MKVHWLLEPEVFRGELAPLIHALDKAAIPHTEMSFGNTYESYVDRLGSGGPVVFHGSIQAGRVFRATTKWRGLFCNFPRFSCMRYYPAFGESLLNNRYFVLPLGELLRLKSWVFEHVASEWGEVFIRPDSAEKSFGGEVASQRGWNTILPPYVNRFGAETLALIAPPVALEEEWRLVVAGGGVITGSQYKSAGKSVRVPGFPSEVGYFAMEVLRASGFVPEAAWTLDVCKTSRGEIRVLEAGPFSTCGLYAADHDIVVQVLSQIASE